MAVEVSPNDTFGQIEERVLSWLHAGCKLVIVIEPELHSITLHRAGNDVKRLTKSDHMDISDVIPGSILRLTQIFD